MIKIKMTKKKIKGEKRVSKCIAFAKTKAG